MLKELLVAPGYKLASAPFVANVLSVTFDIPANSVVLPELSVIVPLFETLAESPQKDIFAPELTVAVDSLSMSNVPATFNVSLLFNVSLSFNVKEAAGVVPLTVVSFKTLSIDKMFLSSFD